MSTAAVSGIDISNLLSPPSRRLLMGFLRGVFLILTILTDFFEFSRKLTIRKQSRLHYAVMRRATAADCRKLVFVPKGSVIHTFFHRDGFQKV